jgi:two-component system, OmpR family, phosphate regulon sensor histidine kinase PhoR
MNTISFGLGLLIGMGFWFWQRYLMDRKLKQMLNFMPNNEPEIPLSLVSSLRRNILFIQEEKELLNNDLNHWKSLLENCPLGYLEVDGDNQLIYCNHQARDLLNIQRWQAEDLRLLLEVVRSYELDQIIEKTRNLQQPQQQEWIFYPSHDHFNTVKRSLILQAKTLPLENDKIGVYLENKQQFADLVQSKEQLISDLAHELKTPLTSIKLVAETLQSRLQHQKEGQWLEKMLQEINRLINLVKDSLELNQITNNPQENLKFTLVEIKDLILSAWLTLEPLADQKQLTIEYEGEDNLQIQGDSDRLIQVFVNILHNSIKYSPEQTTIKIETKIFAPIEKNQSILEIKIIDQGQGFNPTDLPHIFERLYRGDSSRTRQIIENQLQLTTGNHVTSGNGLGLAIVKQIIITHGGKITANNHPETGGAIIKIELPL